jgi:serine/threonine protein phosphatase PrpC
MQITSYGITDQGKVRRQNEDALLIDEAHQAYAVADGIGGLPGGAEASSRIVELLKDTYDHLDSSTAQTDLAELIIRINRIVAKEGIAAHPLTGSGSTLTIAQIIGDQLLIGHVGDSAAYHLRNDDFVKITIDHTMEQELIDRAGESARKRMPTEYSHTLTRCVGLNEEEIRVDQTRITIARGDRLLLCTDGLNKVLSNDEIKQILNADMQPAAICQKLVDAANAQKGPDNITVIALLIH